LRKRKRTRLNSSGHVTLRETSFRLGKCPAFVRQVS
jgi:hypothetical protein